MNIHKNITAPFFIFVFLLTSASVRPVYGIPEQVSALCDKLSLKFCGAETNPEEQQDQAAKENKPREITPSEREELVKLTEFQRQLRERQSKLDRREAQMKRLQEDIQSQIAQLERLQKEIEQDIAAKKQQDNERLAKAVQLYSKMEPKRAAESISQLNSKIAVQMLMQLKDKQASAILENMNPNQSAKLIEEIARKK